MATKRDTEYAVNVLDDIGDIVEQTICDDLPCARRVYDATDIPPGGAKEIERWRNTWRTLRPHERRLSDDDQWTLDDREMAVIKSSGVPANA